MTRRETAGVGGKKPRRRRGLGRKAMAVIQPNKGRRAAPKARPTEKGNLRGDKIGRERGGAHPQPLPKGGEKATPEARPAENGDGG